MVKVKGFAGIIFAVALSISAQAPTTAPIIVDAQGMGKTEAEAMLSAKRDAVEKGIGTVIQSETEIKNFQVNRDVVLTRTVGAVTSVTKLHFTLAFLHLFEDFFEKIRIHFLLLHGFRTLGNIWRRRLILPVVFRHGNVLFTSFFIICHLGSL